MSRGKAAVPVPMTPREQALTQRLEAAVHDASLHEAARAAAGRAFEAWHQGHHWGRALFTHPIDADARLAFLRWGLLAELHELAVGDAAPMPELLALGDRSPAGWLVAVDAALRSVGREPAKAAPRVRTNGLPYFRDQDEAVDTLARPGEAVAPRLTIVENSLSEVRLTLAMGAGPEPLTLVQWFEPGRRVPSTRSADPERWRVLNALAGGLHAVERMQLPPAHEQGARAVLAAYLVACMTGRGEPAETVAGVVEALARLRHPAALQPAEGTPPGPGWPHAFGAVAVALQRLAGTYGGPLREPVPGTWVHVLDQDRQTPRAVGQVAEQPAEKPLRRRGARHARQSQEPRVRVVVDGRERGYPLDRLRLYRVSLLG